MSGLSKLNPNRKPPFDGMTYAKELVSKVIGKMPVKHAFLFGSAATNEHTEDSDLDILLVVDSPEQIKLAYSIVQAPHFSKVAVDWIIKTEAEFKKEKDYGGVCFVASHHGKEISLS